MKKSRPGIHRPIQAIELVGSRKGVLLFHGFTATPDCFHYLATKLHEEGFSVIAPVLAGHGTFAEELEQTSWLDWYRSAEEAYYRMKNHCDSICVVGLSMGGLIALHLAHQHRNIRAVSLLATPLFLDGWLIRYLFPLVWKTPLKYLYKYQKKYLVSIKDPQAQRRHQTYDRVPVASVANLLDFQKKVRRELHSIHQPTLIAHAVDDETVPYGNLDYIRACIGADVVETVTLNKSNHIITVDYDKDVVAKRVLKFFKKYS